MCVCEGLGRRVCKVICGCRPFGGVAPKAMPLDFRDIGYYLIKLNQLKYQEPESRGHDHGTGY